MKKMEKSTAPEQIEAVTTHQHSPTRRKGGLITVPFILGTYTKILKKEKKQAFKNYIHCILSYICYFVDFHCKWCLNIVCVISKWIFWESGKPWTSPKYGVLLNERISHGCSPSYHHNFPLECCYKFHSPFGCFNLRFILGSLSHHWSRILFQSLGNCLLQI